MKTCLSIYLIAAYQIVFSILQRSVSWRDLPIRASARPMQNLEGQACENVSACHTCVLMSSSTHMIMDSFLYLSLLVLVVMLISNLIVDDRITSHSHKLVPSAVTDSCEILDHSYRWNSFSDQSLFGAR